MFLKQTNIMKTLEIKEELEPESEILCCDTLDACLNEIRNNCKQWSGSDCHHLWSILNCDLFGFLSSSSLTRSLSFRSVSVCRVSWAKPSRHSRTTAWGSPWPGCWWGRTSAGAGSRTRSSLCPRGQPRHGSIFFQEIFIFTQLGFCKSLFDSLCFGVFLA